MIKRIRHRALPGTHGGPRIVWQVAVEPGLANATAALAGAGKLGWAAQILLVGWLAAFSGACTQRNPNAAQSVLRPPARIVVVAPVLNLSGGDDFDALRVTDLIASEFSAFPEYAVVPVNLVLAELARHNRTGIESPDEALALARAFNADATLVTVITEYNPYDPPIVGLTMQWYPAAERGRLNRIDPVAASRAVAGSQVMLSAAPNAAGPCVQLQHVFNAMHEDVIDELKKYAHDRDEGDSPLKWRKYTKSQDLFVRYCGWSLIRTMVSLSDADHETDSPQRGGS